MEGVAAIVESAAQAASLLREASHALAALEQVQAAQQRSLAQHRPLSQHPRSSLPEEPPQRCRDDARQQPPSRQQQQPQQQTQGSAPLTVEGAGGPPPDSAASVSAQAASDRVEEALLGLLASQQHGRRDQQRAFAHLRMVLETYVRARDGLRGRARTICCVIWPGWHVCSVCVCGAQMPSNDRSNHSPSPLDGCRALPAAAACRRCRDRRGPRRRVCQHRVRAAARCILGRIGAASRQRGTR